MTSEIEFVVTPHGISVFVPGERASADLTGIGSPQVEGLVEEFDPGSGEWLWFSRLINQSGKPGLGTKMLDRILAYCQENGYSILNQVSAYGGIRQGDLEKWYMSKGFVPLDCKKYRNSVLVWRPEPGAIPDAVLSPTGILQDIRLLGELERGAGEGC